MGSEFIGRGWSFPIGVDDTGAIRLVGGSTEIEQSIRLILGTAPGERPMRPDFGCRVHDYVFAPADDTTAGRVSYEVRESLRRWEPRIDVADVDVELDPDEASTMYINIRYSLRGENDPRNLVFPFYTIPYEDGEPEPTEIATALDAGHLQLQDGGNL